MAPELATDTESLEAAAARMLGQEVTSTTPVTGGGNNRVHRITAGDGTFALKFYPPQDDDPRDRLDQEFRALEFMTAHGLTCVPRPIAIDPALRCGIYEWIDGAPVNQPGEQDIKAMIDLVSRLAALQTTDGAKDLVPASAHCFSATGVTRQLDDRLARLRDAGEGEENLNAFLEKDFCPRVAPLISHAKDLYANTGIDFDTDLAPAHRVLSPSDFGFHNALRRPDGQIVFLDFEYFGWDDPVKMISDVIWHPGSNLPPALGNAFREQTGEIFQDREGDHFTARLNALHPLIGMIWVLIILNEFLPERWHRRVAAGKTADAGKARTGQLAIAKNFLKRISETRHEHA